MMQDHEQYTFMARSLVIGVPVGTVIGDEEDFMLYLKRKLSSKRIRLKKNQMYSTEYELNMVQFYVVEGEHALSPVYKKRLPFDVSQCCFMVYARTIMKLFYEKQEGKNLPCVIGYDTELQPLYDVIEAVFKNHSKQPQQETIIPKTEYKETCSGVMQSNISVSKTNPNYIFQNTVDGNSSVDDLMSKVNKCSLNQGIDCVGGSYGDSDCRTPTTSSMPAFSNKGILVHGPSGCGKTWLLMKLQHSYSSVMLNRPVTKISTLFDLAAARAPCLLLLDNVDRMENLISLQSLLDGNVEGVLVVATASNTALLPSALRQPGRLGLEVELGRPDEAARTLILDNMLDEVGLKCEPAILEELATRSHGMTGQDLNRLVLQLTAHTGSDQINKQDIVMAIEKYNKSLEISSKSSKKISSALANVPKAAEIKVCSHVKEFEYMSDTFHLVLELPHIYEDLGLSPPSRILLYGPTGCGKTWIVNVLARKFSLIVHKITRADVFGKYFGESEKNLDEIFDKAINSAPCIVHFDGFDGLASVRDGEQHETESRVVNLLKSRLDGATRLSGFIVVAETTRPDILDEAIIRSGRFHRFVHIGLPDVTERLQLAWYFLEDTEPSGDQLQQLAALTVGYTVGEVQQVCREVRHYGWNNLQETVESVQVGTTAKQLKRFQKFEDGHRNKISYLQNNTDVHSTISI